MALVRHRLPDEDRWYFKLDALYDLDGTGDEYQFLIAQIPVDGSPEAEASGYFNMFVRETRLNLDVRETGQDGPAKQFFLEVDFFDESSFSPRLRHAYIIYGNLLVGQTWTTIAELASLPFTIDFAAGDALFGTRTPQVRWQQNVNSSWSWAVGLEMLQDSGIYNPYNLGGSASPQLPVLAARLTHTRPNSVRTLAGLVQQLHWDGEGVGPDSTAAAWALIFGGRQNLGSSANFFTWNLAYGDGTPDTIMALTGSDANANLTLDGRLVTRQGYSVALGLGHAWSDTLASNLALAWTDLENIGGREADAIQSGGVGHLNLIWTPRQKFSTGIELMWGKRENADGDDGSATRVQTMVKYFF
ncbi:MAG: DcaP family trimeric outer membrane transporter [Ilumatobacteraceae bacterium]